MGWDFTQGASKADIIASLTKEESGDAQQWSNKEQKSLPLGYRYNRRTLEWSVRGNVLWTVEEVIRHKNPDETTRFIGCYLLSKQRNYGYGYKAMCERAGPYYYSCPLKFLNMVPVACQEWRDKVIAHTRGYDKAEVRL